ncbi:hypothetical protein [Phenylobacterium sp.]|uniref:hypothetical protein n=1 Tax=Phenylobacterium sp. TaxID=1871053 RepID=UPI00374CC750
MIRALVIAAVLALATSPAVARPLSVGFYLPWDAASRASVVRHAASLDVMAPMSGALDSAAGRLRWQPDAAPAALPARGRKPKVFPVISNAHDEIWDTAAADGALLDPKAGEAFIGALAAAAKAQSYGGYILDFENLSPQATPAYAPFLARLRTALKPLGRELWVTVSLGADPGLIRQLDAATDAVVIMAYDQCWATGTPGPVAGQDWFEATLDAKLPSAKLPSAKQGGADLSRYVIALGAYGYDWPPVGTATVISAPAAAGLAEAQGQTVTREPPAENPHFSYGGHTVWYLDAQTFRAQRAAAEARHTRGVAIWRLGLEDPAIWTKAAPPRAVPPHAAAPGLGPAPPPVCFAQKPK